MDQNQKTQKLLQKVQAFIKSSDALIADSQKKLARLEDNLQKIDDQHARAQAAIDKDIKKIIQAMDYQTAKFVKETE